jgi:hypothetical protein
MKMFIFSILLSLLISNDDLLKGRWESRPSSKGNVTGVLFKKDSVMEAYVNKKAFASGIYHFSATDSVLSFTDNGCNGAKGVYKVIFFSKNDSIRFKAIADTCEERKQGMQRLILGRVK